MRNGASGGVSSPPPLPTGLRARRLRPAPPAGKQFATAQTKTGHLPKDYFDPVPKPLFEVRTSLSAERAGGQGG